MDEQWMKEMQQKMADYQWPAPELSWDELDHALTANHPPMTHQLWLRRIAAAAIILLISGVGYWSLLHHDTEQMLPTTASVSNQPIDATSHGDRHTVRSENHLTGCLSPCEVTEVSAPEPETVIPVSAEDPDTLNIIATEEQKQPNAAEEKVLPTQKDSPVIYPSDLHQRKHLDNRLTAKVYMSSTIMGSRTDYFSALGEYASSDPLQDSVKHIHHRQPVRFGLSLRYRLNAHWSVESGLTYTRLSSDINITAGRSTTVIEQQLNYIGLPLNISYEFYKSRHFDLYLTVGGTTEKCLDTSSWQFSLNGAVGAEYQLTDFLNLYAEPGFGYYFKNGSTMPTIYQDHPLTFNLSFGLRFILKHVP